MSNKQPGCIAAAIALIWALLAAIAAPQIVRAADSADFNRAYSARWCNLTRRALQEAQADKFWADNDRHIGNLNPAARQQWVEDYAVTVELMQRIERDYHAHCG